MLKIALRRGAVSFFIGIGLSQIVNIIISLAVGKGGYISVLPDFAARFPNELSAVIAQALLTGFLSLAFAMASVFFLIERWSFLRQCVMHCLVTAAVWIPVVWFVWIPRELPGLLIAFLNFAAAYAVTWGAQVAVNRRVVRRINEKIQSKEPEHERH
ncbi:MAG: DUF3021 domain-containing protein [Clostridia bacterium]|nr:DUF3021 domain-containing protein [Clostridia bacterium]